MQINKFSLSVLVFSLCAILNTSTLFGIEITGAGATFPYPFYAKLFNEYNTKFGTRINYQAIGSGGGISQLTNKTVDFGASDTFLTNEQLAAMPSNVVHIPTCLGAVAIAYKLPGAISLKLTPEVLAGIYLGKIIKWDDPLIAQINPGVKLPKNRIIVVHRSDGSGTSAIFTDYLCKVSPEWKKRVGAGKDVKWPAGLGGKGNAGVASLIKQMDGAIGYIELNYAVENKMSYAALKNKAGNFVVPNLDSTSAAAKDKIPADTRIFLTDSSDKNAYPISGFTWLLLYKELSTDIKNPAKAAELVKLCAWVIKDGQAYAKVLGYSPLTKQAADLALANLKTITFKGKPLLK